MAAESMLEGDEVTALETLAIQLWYTWLAERGDLAVSAWLKGADPLYLAAQKWIYLDGREKGAWLAVAAKVPSLMSAMGWVQP